MTTVLFADRDGSALGALGERTVPALLPVQSVPLLERFIEALVANGIRSALLVTGPRANEIQKRFGKGLRWGIALDYIRREESESPADVLRRLEQRLDGDTLVFQGDAGAEEAIREFLYKLEDRKEPIVGASVHGRPVGFWRIRPQALKKLVLARDPAHEDWKFTEDQTPIEIQAEFALLDSLANYRKADRADKPAISSRAFVDPKAELGPGTTVAEEAVVCSGARLKETAVLPRTVIPSGVTLENCIVCGNLVLDASTAKESLLTDRLPEKVSTDAVPGFGSRLAGFLLLFLSIPLWPVAFIWSLVANAGHAMRPLVFMGNVSGQGPRAPIKTFEFETAIPVFRDLPLLLALASGKIALSGVAPLSPEETKALKEGWQRVREEAPVGLLAPSRMIVPPSAPDEVHLVVDAFQARRALPNLLRLGISALFSGKGWIAPKAFNPDDIKEIPV